MIRVREAKESDVEQIREVYLAIYGKYYSHPQFYDIQSIKRWSTRTTPCWWSPRTQTPVKW